MGTVELFPADIYSQEAISEGHPSLLPDVDRTVRADCLAMRQIPEYRGDPQRTRSLCYRA